ncbi:MAG: hypothetical protein ACQ5SW_00695 [Sphaerochaetaceae bacterium]
MKQMTRYIGMLLLLLGMGVLLFAADEVFIGDGDIASLHLYDSQGTPLEATSEQAQNIAEGWIISNPDTPILIVTPRGTINVFEDSLLVTGNLVGMDAGLYLVSGKVSFNAYDMEGGMLTVTTPVSRFRLLGNGEMLVISTEEEESVTTFTGQVEAYNALTGVKREVKTFEKLFMQERMARLEHIEAGYYLTYATYPDMMLAKQIIQELSEPVTVPLPLAPNAKIERVQLVPPVVKGVTIQAFEEKPSALPMADDAGKTPAPLQTLQVEVVHTMVPEPISKISNTILPPPQGTIKITIRPLIPEVPSILPADQSVQEPPIPASPHLEVIEEVPLVIAPIIEETTVGTEVPESSSVSVQPMLEEEPETETTVAQPAYPAEESRPSLVFSAEQAEITGSFGVELGYRFTFDGSEDNTMSHQLFLKPYWNKGLFSIRLQGFLEIEDFSTFNNSVYPVPTASLARLSYVFSYIDQMRIGYSSSPFYLTMGRKFPIASELSSLFAPSLLAEGKLAVLNQITIGAFSLVSTFDDLYFGELTRDNRQYGSSLLQFTPTSGYRMSIALGALGEVDRLPWSLNLYPFLGFSFPVIDSRTTQMKILLQASGYLPTYPQLDIDSFIDTSVDTFFPNYLLSTGFSLQKGQFSSKVLVSLTKGENHPFLANEFASFLDTSYSSDFEASGDFRYEGNILQMRVLFNLPFQSDATLADLTTAAHQADYSQISFTYTKNRLQVGLGFAQLGIIDNFSAVVSGAEDLLSLFRGPYSTSFLSLQYVFDLFTLRVKAQYPAKADTTGYTIPVLNVTASLNLDKQL